MYFSLYMLGGGGGGGAPKRNVFLGKNFANPTTKNAKSFLANLEYELKNKYPPLSQNKRDTVQDKGPGDEVVVTLVLYHFCHMHLISAIFCSLKQCDQIW
jgi:hypothetical protein